MPQQPQSLDAVLPFAPAGTGSLALLGVVMVVAMAIVHIAFAVGVLTHAKVRRPMFVPGWIWALATLLTGLLGVLAYWVVHISTLSPRAKHEDP